MKTQQIDLLMSKIWLLSDSGQKRSFSNKFSPFYFSQKTTHQHLIYFGTTFAFPT